MQRHAAAGGSGCGLRRTAFSSISLNEMEPAGLDLALNQEATFAPNNTHLLLPEAASKTPTQRSSVCSRRADSPEHATRRVELTDSLPCQWLLSVKKHLLQWRALASRFMALDPIAVRWPEHSARGKKGPAHILQVPLPPGSNVLQPFSKVSLLKT